MKIFALSESVSLALIGVTLIKNAENYREFEYKDEFGNSTIGWGFLMDSFSPVKIKEYLKKGISIDEANSLLSMRVVHIMHTIDIAFPNLNRNVYLVFIDMIYNLGITQFTEFTTFLSFVKLDEINFAVKDLTNTLWYKQVENRAVRDCFNLLSTKNYYLI